MALRCDVSMTSMPGSPTSRASIQVLFRFSLIAALLPLLSAPALAHASSLGGSRESMTIPAWLVLLTGGAVIGASFLLVSMVTDRRFIARINEVGPSVHATPPNWLGHVGRLFALVVLVALVVVGFWGPQTSTASLTVLGVWALWWAGYAMSVYLVGNSWPVVNPWRLAADAIPGAGRFSYPNWVGAWPSVLGLFALVWTEVTTPITDRPSLLATVIATYSVVTVAGAALFGPASWFESADPVSRVFRFFGHSAPLQWTENGIETGLPGWHLVDGDLVDGWDDVAFVVGLLWLTTFDGFVATPSWEAVVSPLVAMGVPARVAYFALVTAGYAIFVAAFVVATRYAKRVANTPLSTRTLAFAFAQSLLPIAAGYHLAHYLGYFVHFVPSTIVLAGRPFAPPAQLPVFVVPDWFGTLQLAFVLVGHVVAIWVAHGVAFERFTGRLQPIRSQYPFSVVMILYTMISIGIVYQPSIAPPYL